jgi:hypothetical protein
MIMKFIRRSIPPGPCGRIQIRTQTSSKTRTETCSQADGGGRAGA